jgi:4-aminobutyrate aminotransferase
MGTRLKKGIMDISHSEKSGITGVRGLGLMIGIEFDSKNRRDKNLSNAFKKGLLMLPAGQKAMRVIPPLVITSEEVDEGLNLMHEVFVSG